MRRTAVFPGSFDPIHIGHVDIIQRALPLFDKIIIGIGINTQKKYLFPIELRKEWIRRIFQHESRVDVMTYEGLTVNFCEQQNARSILRGLRSSADFNFEKNIAQMNQALNRDIETVFMLSNPSLAMISSSIVRDVLLNDGDVSQFVPEEIEDMVMLKNIIE
jgi:pantetheine-phosphate adenylyltransferase